MNMKTNKKTLQRSRSNQCTTRIQNMHQNSSDRYLDELEKWVQHVIDKSEKNGDVCKRKQFAALRTELHCLLVC